MSEEVEVVTNLSGVTVDSSQVTCLTETLIENHLYMCRYSGLVRITTQPDTFFVEFKMLLPVPPSISGLAKSSKGAFFDIESRNDQHRLWFVRQEDDGRLFPYEVTMRNNGIIDIIDGVYGLSFECRAGGNAYPAFVCLDDMKAMYTA